MRYAFHDDLDKYCIEIELENARQVLMACYQRQITEFEECANVIRKQLLSFIEFHSSFVTVITKLNELVSCGIDDVIGILQDLCSKYEQTSDKYASDFRDDYTAIRTTIVLKQLGLQSRIGQLKLERDSAEIEEQRMVVMVRHGEADFR